MGPCSAKLWFKWIWMSTKSLQREEDRSSCGCCCSFIDVHGKIVVAVDKVEYPGENGKSRLDHICFEFRVNDSRDPDNTSFANPVSTDRCNWDTHQRYFSLVMLHRAIVVRIVHSSQCHWDPDRHFARQHLEQYQRKSLERRRQYWDLYCNYEDPSIDFRSDHLQRWDEGCPLASVPIRLLPIRPHLRPMTGRDRHLSTIASRRWTINSTLSDFLSVERRSMIR